MEDTVKQVFTFAGSFIGMMLLFYIVIRLIAYCNKDKQTTKAGPHSAEDGSQQQETNDKKQQ